MYFSSYSVTSRDDGVSRSCSQCFTVVNTPDSIPLPTVDGVGSFCAQSKIGRPSLDQNKFYKIAGL